MVSEEVFEHMKHEHGGDSTQESYDRVAADYARHYLDEFEHKPLDRELLERFAGRVVESGGGRVCDLGCGPGQVAHYLQGLRMDMEVIGIDLSPAMLQQARLASPGIDFQQGNMRALDLPDGWLAGIAAFYSIIHIPRNDVTTVLKEFRRVLRVKGILLLCFHIGTEVLHAEELLGNPISLDFTFFEPDEMQSYLREAGFSVDEVIERPPYPEVEYPSRRAYIFARNPVT